MTDELKKDVPAGEGSLTDNELRAEAVPVEIVGSQIPVQPVDMTKLTVTPDTATAREVINQQVTTMDYLVLRYAVIGLIAAIILSILGTLILSVVGSNVPDNVTTGLFGMGGAAVGALATMLVRPPSSQ